MKSTLTPANQAHGSKALKVLKANGLCSIQDLGRPGSQHLGFSAGGAADEYAFLMANKLLGNVHDAAALEITLGQLVLAAECDCTIAITGADSRASINDNAIENWQTYQLSAGDILSFQMPVQALHTYLGVNGGINSPLWLGSRAQTFNELALTKHKGITEGSKIPLSENCSDPSFEQDLSKPHLSTPLSKQPFSKQYRQNQPVLVYENFYPQGELTLRFIPHPLWFSFDRVTKQQFLDASYQINSDSNRMGYRLIRSTAALDSDTNTDIVTEKKQTDQQVSVNLPLAAKLSKAVTFGSIQLPDFQQPIVLMKERQTIGGYPVIGSVMQTDLFRLSQKRPGQSVRFVPTTLQQAQQQLLSFYQKLTIR